MSIIVADRRTRGQINRLVRVSTADEIYRLIENLHDVPGFGRRECEDYIKGRLMTILKEHDYARIN
jgi:hypothetical protein